MSSDNKKAKAAKHKPAPVKAPASTPVKADARPGDSRTLMICLVLAVMTLALYGRVRQFEFLNFDDMDYVTENDFVKHGLTRESLNWAFTGVHARNWHPLTTLSLLINRDLLGLKPASFHLVNLFFHVANTLLVFLVLRKMTRAVWCSAVVAALFAWHPLHVESVAWVAERKDVLSGFFWLLTMWAYARYVERPGAGRYVLALVFFALGLMSKPMVVTLPFVLLLLDYWPLGRMNFKSGESSGKTPAQLVVEKLPFFALCVMASVVTFVVQQKNGAVATVENVPLTDRCINAVISYARYLEKTICPLDLAAFYPYPRTWPAWRLPAALVLLAGISVSVLVWGRRHRFLITGWLWYLGTLVPVIGLVQVGSQAMADRYTYLPLLGIFIMAVWGAHEFMREKSPGKSLAAVVALVGCLAVSWRQIGYWQDSVRLFEHTVQVTTRNEFAHSILGKAYEERGRLDDALAQFLESMRLQTKNYDVHFNIATVLAKQGKIDDAEKEFLEVLRLKPDHFESRYNLASFAFQRQDWNGAVTHYNEALRLNPNSSDAESNLASALMMSGQMEAAIGHFEKAVRINPAHAHARANLGYLLSKLGRTPEAIQQLNEALRLNPDSVMALYRLSWLLATDDDAKFRNGPVAVQLAERAVTLSGGNEAGMLDALAAAYAEAGRFSDAVATEQKALNLAAGKESPQLVTLMRQRLELYQRGSAYHVSSRL